MRSRLAAVIVLAVPVGMGDVIPASAGVDTAITTTQAVSGTEFLDGVACGTANTCEAVGYGDNPVTGDAEGVVVTITNGTPGVPEVVSGTSGLSGVACPSANTCVAVGADHNTISPPDGVVVIITNGTPGTPQAVPGTYGLMGVACPNANTCEAVGTSSHRLPEGG